MASRRLPLLESTSARGAHVHLDTESRHQDKIARPRYAVWELTLRCDLGCHHCGSRAGRARPDELSLPEALDLVGQLAALGVREVTLIGGEAYLYDGFVDVVRAITSRGMVCTMTSGGRGIDAQLARIIQESGMASVSISIDGTEQTHDSLRGLVGSFEAACNALGHLREAGVAIAANSQINRQNQAELEELFEVVRRYKCHGWQIALTVPMGRAADDENLILQPIDLLDLMPRLISLAEQARALGIRLLPGNNVGYFGPGEPRLRGVLGRQNHGSCSAGKTVLGIEANGDIKGCPSLFSREWVGGNIRTNSLETIWERSERLRYIRDRTVEELWGYCRSCYYAESCKAGCTWTASALFGRPGNNPYCHHRALDFKSRGLMERLERVALPPGEAFDHGSWEIHVEPAIDPVRPVV